MYFFFLLRLSSWHLPKGSFSLLGDWFMAWEIKVDWGNEGKSFFFQKYFQHFGLTCVFPMRKLRLCCLMALHSSPWTFLSAPRHRAFSSASWCLIWQFLYRCRRIINALKRRLSSVTRIYVMNSCSGEEQNKKRFITWACNNSVHKFINSTKLFVFSSWRTFKRRGEKLNYLLSGIVWSCRNYASL